MVRKLLAICGVLLLTGCRPPADQTPAEQPPAAAVSPPARAPVTARFECESGIVRTTFYDYAERQATTPVHVPVSNGGTTTYDAVTEARRLRVVIEERECSDTMSGEREP